MFSTVDVLSVIPCDKPGKKHIVKNLFCDIVCFFSPTRMYIKWLFNIIGIRLNQSMWQLKGAQQHKHKKNQR